MSDEPPRVQIAAPSAGVSIPDEQALAYEVSLNVNPWGKEFHVLVGLDDFPPRSFGDPKTSLRLSELVPKTRELESGPHRLFAAVLGPEGLVLRAPAPGMAAAVTVSPFWVGVGSTQEVAEAMAGFRQPQVLLLSPRGTYNGEHAADDVSLDFAVLGARLQPGALAAKAEVLVEDERHEVLLSSEVPIGIRGLPSGDHTISVSLVNAQGAGLSEPYSRAKRTITINRDAPVE